MNKTKAYTSTRAILISAALAFTGSACATAPTAEAVAQEAAAPEVTAPEVMATGQTATLTLEVRGVRAGRGPVMVAVFNSEEAWRGGPPATATMIAADAAVVTAEIAGLAPGAYGIKIFQDLDADGAMDANPFGIPSEPYGFSNDAPVRFGPPAWQAARFDVSAAAVSHTITLPE